MLGRFLDTFMVSVATGVIHSPEIDPVGGPTSDLDQMLYLKALPLVLYWRSKCESVGSIAQMT